MGVQTIMDAKKILVVVSGSDKVFMVRAFDEDWVWNCYVDFYGRADGGMIFLKESGCNENVDK